MTPPSPESAWENQAGPHHGLAVVAGSAVLIHTYQHLSLAVSFANKIIPGISQSHIQRLELPSLEEEACPGIHNLRAGSFPANVLAKVTMLILTELLPLKFFTHQMGNNTYPRYLTVFVLFCFCFLEGESVN